MLEEAKCLTFRLLPLIKPWPFIMIITKCTYRYRKQFSLLRHGIVASLAFHLVPMNDCPSYPAFECKKVGNQPDWPRGSPGLTFQVH